MRAHFDIKAMENQYLLLKYSDVQFHNGMDPWMSKEPNNGKGNEDCVVMDGKWNDVPCDKKTFSICEST